MQELEILYENLSPEQREIYDCVGAQAYGNLVRCYGGISIYIAKADSVIRSARDEQIRKDFNGYNIRYLVNKYNLSERTIRGIVSNVRREKQNAPMDGQVTFEEYFAGNK